MSRTLWLCFVIPPFFSFLSFFLPFRNHGVQKFSLFTIQFFHVKADQGLCFGFGVDVGVRNFPAISKGSKQTRKFYPCFLRFVDARGDNSADFNRGMKGIAMPGRCKIPSPLCLPYKYED